MPELVVPFGVAKSRHEVRRRLRIENDSGERCFRHDLIRAGRVHDQRVVDAPLPAVLGEDVDRLGDLAGRGSAARGWIEDVDDRRGTAIVQDGDGRDRE